MSDLAAEITVYANDNDRDSTHWLSKLPFKFDCIDDRSIKEVQADDVVGFTQCHFFAGIGGWPLALQIAGWPDAATVWTGSCPCQPFSAAGKRRGIEDERHLWPEFRRLIDECRPATIFGEQVASKDGRDWLAAVRTDLEALGYAVGAADLCAAGVGAPHIRQRLYWVAHSSGEGLEERKKQSARQEFATTERSGDVGRVANSRRERSDAWRGHSKRMEAKKRCESVVNNQSDCGMGNTMRCGRGQDDNTEQAGDTKTTSGPWARTEFIPCRDGKARPVKPGVRLLANGVSGRVAQLRGLGNAIVPQVAAEFVAAFMESIKCKLT